MNLMIPLLLMEVIGAFFVMLAIRRNGYGYSFAEFTSLSFLLGIGFAAYQLFLFHLFGIGFVLKNVAMIPAVMLLIMISVAFSKPQRLKVFASAGRGQKWNASEWLLAAGIVFQLLWIILLVLPTPVHSHDAVANYALKAKIFYFAGGVPEGFFAWSEKTVAHPDYPLLVPFSMVWTYVFTGLNDVAVTMLMPAIYLAFIGLFYSQARRFFDRSYALLATFFLATVPQLVDYATIVHADLVLTAFVTCAFAYFLLYTRTRNVTHLVLSSLLIGFSVWIKNEAVVFAGAFAAVLIFFAARSDPSGKRRILREVIMSFIVIAVIAAPWLITRSLRASANVDMDLSSITPERLWQNVKDIPILLDLFQQEVFGPKKWNILWVIVFAGMIWKRKLLWKGECSYLILFLALSAAGYFAGYMFITGTSLYFYVNTTISRFMLHFCGVALLLLMFLLREEIRVIDSFKGGHLGR